MKKMKIWGINAAERCFYILWMSKSNDCGKIHDIWISFNTKRKDSKGKRLRKLNKIFVLTAENNAIKRRRKKITWLRLQQYNVIESSVKQITVLSSCISLSVYSICILWNQGVVQNLRTVHAEMEDKVSIHLFLQFYIGPVWNMSNHWRIVCQSGVHQAGSCLWGGSIQGQEKHLCWSNSCADSGDSGQQNCNAIHQVFWICMVSSTSHSQFFN